MYKNFSHLIWLLFLVLSCDKNAFRDPNDSPDNAWDLKNGETMEDYVRISKQQAHYYNFEVTDPSIVKITVDNAPQRFRVSVFSDPSEQIIMMRSDIIPQNQSVILWSGPFDKGKHFVKIEPVYGDSLYKFKFELEIDPNEVNNSFDKATVLQDNIPATGKILAINDGGNLEDVDFYKFEIKDKSASLKFLFKTPSTMFPSGRDLRLSIYGFPNDNALLDYIDVGPAQLGGLWAGPFPPGTYYAVINHDGRCNCNSIDSYTLTLNLDNTDQYEPNDFPLDNATSLVIDEIYEGIIFFPNFRGEKDIDWFKFTPTQSGLYKFDMITPIVNQELRATLYAAPPNDNNALGYIDENNGSTVSFQNMALTAGTTYWVKVEFVTSYAESDKSYKVKLSKE